MKKILLGLLLVVVFLLIAAPVAQAQSITTIWNAKSYVVSQKDTTTTTYNFGLYLRASLYIQSTDSIKVVVYIDKRAKGMTAWVASDSIVTSSLLTTTSANVYFDGPCRDGVVEKLGGVNTETRFRTRFEGTDNASKGTQKFTVRMVYR